MEERSIAATKYPWSVVGFSRNCSLARVGQCRSCEAVLPIVMFDVVQCSAVILWLETREDGRQHPSQVSQLPWLSWVGEID